MSRRRSAVSRRRREKAERWSAASSPGPFADDDVETWFTATGEAELTELLHWRWDPIGIADHFPYAANEYASYCRQLVELLEDGADADEIADRLAEISRDWIAGEDPVAPRVAPTKAAEAIVAWHEASRRRWRDFDRRPAR